MKENARVLVGRGKNKKNYAGFSGGARKQNSDFEVKKEPFGRFWKG